MSYHYTLKLSPNEIRDLLVNLNLGSIFLKVYAEDSDTSQMIAKELKRLENLLDNRKEIIEGLI